MKRLLIVRHAESELNVAGRWAGQIETPLTNKGKNQARQAGRQLNQSLPKIDLIISSPMSRAFDTAKLIAKEIGYPAAKIKKEPLLKERGLGILERTSVNEFYTQHSFADIDTMAGVEKVIDLHGRAKAVFNYLKSLPEDNILVVTHGATGRAIRAAAERLPYTHEYDNDFRAQYHIANAEIVEIDPDLLN